MPNRPLNMIEQGNLLTWIQRDLIRIGLQMQRILDHLQLDPVTEDEVDDVLATFPDLDTRTHTTDLEPGSGRPWAVPLPPDEDEDDDEGTS